MKRRRKAQTELGAPSLMSSKSPVQAQMKSSLLLFKLGIVEGEVYRFIKF